MHLSLFDHPYLAPYEASLLRNHKGGEVTPLPDLMRPIVEDPFNEPGMTDEFCAIRLASTGSERHKHQKLESLNFERVIDLIRI